MPVSFQIPLDIPNVDIISVQNGDQGELILELKSTLDYTYCRCCGQKITELHGHDRPIRLQHLPILERKVYVELRPKRYRCRDCEGDPTTTQILDWYTQNIPRTHALEKWLLKMLVNSTVSDVSRQCQVSYDAVESCLNRHIGASINWEQVAPFSTMGLDEIALRKGHKDFVCVVTALDQNNQVIVLAILPDRLKQTVLNFLNAMPKAIKSNVQRVCSDMYEGYINAIKEALPNADVVIDRFHVAKSYNKGVDDLRKATLRSLKSTLSKEEYAELKGVMWPFRRHYQDLKEESFELLVKLFTHAPELEQAWFLRHELFSIYDSPYSPEQAEQQFNNWINKVRRSGLTCFDRFIQLFYKSKTDILTYFDGRHNSGFVEGLNNKLKVIKRRCFGLINPVKLFQHIQIDLQFRTGLMSTITPTVCV